MSFANALDLLDPFKRSTVEAQLLAWDGGGCPKWARVARNIWSETALPTAHFTSLLHLFADYLGDGSRSPECCWIEACKSHQFCGPVMPMPLPAVVGRATSINHYAKLVSRSASTILSEAYVESMLRKVALDGVAASPREARILRRALLGENVIWATFHPTDPEQTPFESIPRTTEAVRTALGLGHCSETETLILLTYSTTTRGGPLELFRPTVGEAGAFCWYCPHPDVDSRFGMTEPLLPNPHRFPPMPEVVHREIYGETLVFPLYLTV